MRVVILVPRRDGKPDRDALWVFCRQWWREQQPDWELFEGHHDEGLFNRSAAVNRAAVLADQPEPWDVAAIIDSDVICDPERTRRAVGLAVETGRMVLPYSVRFDLNDVGSQKVMAGYQGSWRPFIRRTYANQVSSVVVVTRALWDAVQGFDEAFSGWGREDNAFEAACETFAPGPLIRIPGDLWHLYHATAPEGQTGTPTYVRNKGRKDLYMAARGNKDAIRRLRQSAAFDPAAGIPKILHRVVPERTTREVERWWVAFKRLHPDWTLMTHRDPLDPADWPETSAKWSECANGAQLAGLLRLEALWRWGGVYVDSDVEPFRPLDSLLPVSAFAAWEDAKCVPDAVIGAVPSHPAIKKCLDLALSRVPGDTWRSGPGVTTAVFPGRSDVLLLPPGSFYQIHYRDPERARLMRDRSLPKRSPWAFALHHYEGSWLAKEAVS